MKHGNTNFGHFMTWREQCKELYKSSRNDCRSNLDRVGLLISCAVLLIISIPHLIDSDYWTSVNWLDYFYVDLLNICASETFRKHPCYTTWSQINFRKLKSFHVSRLSIAKRTKFAVIWQKGFNDIYEDFDIFVGKLLLWLEQTLYQVVWQYHVSNPLFQHPLLSYNQQSFWQKGIKLIIFISLWYLDSCLSTIAPTYFMSFYQKNGPELTSDR